MKMSYKIDYEKVKAFFEWLRMGYSKDAYTEIKLMDIEDFDIYNHVRDFSLHNPDIIMRKNCQFFIKTFDELFKIMEFRDNLFCKHTKMCYSINPKFIVEGDITGKYENMKTVDMVFLDIEKVNHGALTDEDMPYMNIFVDAVLTRLVEYGLKNPTIVHSGGGVHLLYKVKSKLIDKKRIYGYKTLIEELEELNTPLFKTDHCVDMTRCIGLPETINRKRMKKVIIKKLAKLEINDFNIKSKKRISTIPKVKLNRKNFNLKTSLEYKIIMHPEVPQGSIHSTLLFAYKLLLRELQVPADELMDLEDELNEVRDSHHKLDLEIGIDGKEYNPYIILNWMRKNADWCKKHNIK